MARIGEQQVFIMARACLPAFHDLCKIFLTRADILGRKFGFVARALDPLPWI
ncbi:hypothetical protein MnTg02_01869 [bacterium MnTg02]|nr:hypothetical protein MnTg02_01869 [bacterium MnTg02]